ncbi:MAG: hypothetical protein Q8927_18715 [Bacteroidota bacterium]|nr:hypothetical protein [Bacteroidota bacterium]MDP4218238.1 hypothetical protein [Bacteroidota bacterium]MDP4244378.1 hypothetical protein [Bacteroidota bacterium]MDP4254946.1 hypothetical protein [Bacteroidota bacterium]MDP4259393.1 hypothetical protein [Bacteroidota bacterium]
MENEGRGRMDSDARGRKRKGYMGLMAAIMNSGRGLLICLIGVFFLLAPKFGVDFKIADTNRYIFSGLCLLYGGWRIYRGYSNNSYR